jgi:hypothetical protein
MGLLDQLFEKLICSNLDEIQITTYYKTMEAKSTLKTTFMLFSGNKKEMDGKSFNKCMKDSKLLGK